jgi:hypothetical protein
MPSVRDPRSCQISVTRHALQRDRHVRLRCFLEIPLCGRGVKFPDGAGEHGAAVSVLTRSNSRLDARSSGAGRPGTGTNRGVYTWSAVIDALYQRAIARACSIACCEVSEKSTGQRIRLIRTIGHCHLVGRKLVASRNKPVWSCERGTSRRKTGSGSAWLSRRPPSVPPAQKTFRTQRSMNVKSRGAVRRRSRHPQHLSSRWRSQAHRHHALCA